jgi:hypothetical protein
MQEIIEQLTGQLALLKEEQARLPIAKGEFGSLEETRQMFIDTVFTNAINVIQSGIGMLQIINKNLY